MLASHRNTNKFSFFYLGPFGGGCRWTPIRIFRKRSKQNVCQDLLFDLDAIRLIFDSGSGSTILLFTTSKRNNVRKLSFVSLLKNAFRNPATVPSIIRLLGICLRFYFKFSMMNLIVLLHSAKSFFQHCFKVPKKPFSKSIFPTTCKEC